MMASFSDLSEELLDAIASRVSASGDLFNLVLTSKQLRRIATPYLYGRISLKLGGSQEEYNGLCESAVKLLSRPKQLALVRHLEIRGDWAEDSSGLYPSLVPAIAALVP